MVTPPAPPPTETFRDFSLPPRQGDELELYRVVECSKDRLYLRVGVGGTLLWLVASLIVAAISFTIFWRMPKTWNTTESDIAAAALTVGLGATAVGAYLITTIGKSLEIDRTRRTVSATRFFISSRQYPADRITSVVLTIKKPADTAMPSAKARTDAQVISPPPAVANRVDLALVGTDDAARPIRIEVGGALLWSKENWPVLAATAVHLSHMLGMPLEWDGAMDRLSDVAKEQVAQIKQIH